MPNPNQTEARLLLAKPNRIEPGPDLGKITGSVRIGARQLGVCVMKVDPISNFDFDKLFFLNKNHNVSFRGQTQVAEREKFWQFVNDFTPKKFGESSVKFLPNLTEPNLLKSKKSRTKPKIRSLPKS